jgi:GNAT superfamily N-acetyltransferase
MTSGSDDAVIGKPEHLTFDHDLVDFDSGSQPLDAWLRRRALANEQAGASRTYVVCAREARVVGYYALANGAVNLSTATGRTRRNMPDPIPVIVLGRLAVDRRFQGRGIGRALLRDAVLRALQTAELVGVRAILVHAISEEAKGFYERNGFSASPVDPLTLMITMADAERAVSGR